MHREECRQFEIKGSITYYGLSRREGIVVLAVLLDSRRSSRTWGCTIFSDLQWEVDGHGGVVEMMSLRVVA